MVSLTYNLSVAANVANAGNGSDEIWERSVLSLPGAIKRLVKLIYSNRKQHSVGIMAPKYKAEKR